MSDNPLAKIMQHPDKDEIVAKLVLSLTPKEINIWLREKYQAVGDAKLIIGIPTLKKFKDEYLNYYQTIQNDATALYNNSPSEIRSDPVALVNSNAVYRDMLKDYLKQEIDLKDLIKEMIVAVRARMEQLFIIIQKNPYSTKPDYVIIQWLNVLTNLLEKQETIINGSPDKIIQQNNINIQVLDQHISVVSKVIREVIARLDYDTSLLFVDILNEELKKLKEPTTAILPIDTRLIEARKLEDKITNQLDIPSF